MLGISEPDATIWVAGIAALGGVASSVLSLHVKRNISTGNGHSAGRGIARLEDRMEEHENRLDRIEVKLVEGISEVREALSESREDRARIKFDAANHQTTYKHERKLVE